MGANVKVAVLGKGVTVGTLVGLVGSTMSAFMWKEKQLD